MCRYLLQQVGYRHVLKFVQLNGIGVIIGRVWIFVHREAGSSYEAQKLHACMSLLRDENNPTVIIIKL